MQKLQLYLGSDRIDLFGDETVSVTQTIQNVKDIAKVFTDFSKTFSVPASKKNNLLFKHYYNFNIVGGFDALNKVAGSIELNSIPFKSGFIRLEGVDLKKEKAYAYRITFFGNTVNLKDIIGDDLLSGLTKLNDYTLNYSPTQVKTKLTTAIGTQAVIAPLITHTQRLYFNSNASNQDQGNLHFVNGQQHGVLWDDLKYAIRVERIMDAIEDKYGITFDDSFLISSTSQYYNLFMWLHRKSGAVQPAVQVTEYVSQVNTWTASTLPPAINEGQALMTTTSILTLSANATLRNNLTVTPQSNSDNYQVIIYRNGSVFFTSDFGTGARTFQQTDMGQMNIGSYTVSIVETDGVQKTFTSVAWSLSGITNQGLVNELTWDTNNYTNNVFTSGSFITSTDIEFIITQQIPEMKVMDFLTGIFSLFNLTAFSDDGVNITVKTIDQFYSGGTSYDITKYLEVTKSRVDVALPYRQVNFEYQGLGTFLAKQYEQLNNIGWGTLRFTLNDQIYNSPTEIYTVKPPFEHMQFERLFDQDTKATTGVQYGYCVNENQQPYFGSPVLFYPIHIQNSTDISFRTSQTTHEEIDDYIIPSNSVGISSVSSVLQSNLNFGSEINEYDLTSAGYSDNSLFLNEYTDYVSAVFNTQRRITKVKAFLPLRIIIALELRDEIVIRDETYIINSITTNLQTGESDLELLNVV